MAFQTRPTTATTPDEWVFCVRVSRMQTSSYVGSVASYNTRKGKALHTFVAWFETPNNQGEKTT